MIRMDALTLVMNRTVIRSETQPAQVTSDTEAVNSSDKMSGIHVDLSPLGLQKSKNAGRDTDIDESELPESVRSALKVIRDQQEELEKKREELQKLTNDNSMPPKEKDQKLKQLQAEISSLLRAISDAKSNLLSSMQDQGLSDQQIQKAMQLMA